MFSDILLTVDFDRTLTAPDSSVPQRNLEAIRFFMENGGKFTLNTGRSVPMSAENILGKIPVNAPLLLYNGSAAYDTEKNELLLCRPINLDPRTVCTDVQAHFPDLTLEWQGVDAHYIFKKNPGWEAYCDHNKCAWDYKEYEDIPGPFLKFSVYGEFRDKTVADMYNASAEEVARFREVHDYIVGKYGDTLDFFLPCARIADMHAKGCSKLRAARDLQAMLNRKILVCVGDGDNDTTMLQGADYAFCPSDGTVAHLFPNVCPCGEGAVAEVIYEKIPAILKNKP